MVDKDRYSTSADDYHELMAAITSRFGDSHAFESASFEGADVKDFEP